MHHDSDWNYVNRADQNRVPNLSRARFDYKRKDEDDMAKSTKTYEERIRALEKKEQESIEATKKLIAQRKELEKRKKAEESKKRTHRLCQIGGAVESVLGCPIEEKYLTGQIRKGSWKVEENQMIKKQNALLQKVIATFGKVSGALSIWKEWLNDIRRKQRSNSHDGSNDYTDRGTAEYHGRDASGDTGKGREADVLSGAGRTIAAIRERIIRAASNLAGYRRTAGFFFDRYSHAQRHVV